MSLNAIAPSDTIFADLRSFNPDIPAAVPQTNAETLLAVLKTAPDAVSQGQHLRALDGITGSRSATDRLARGETPAQPDAPSGPGRLDDTRNTGRGSVRPTLGSGTGNTSQITSGKGVPGFPTPPATPATGDGSGPHGVVQPTLGDQTFKQVAYRAADAADAIGLNNAARNLRHYLGNSGATLQVDPAKMRSDLPKIAAKMDASFNDQVRDVAMAKVKADYRGKPMQFQITTPWNGAYATKGQSQDWFYAVGGFSYAHTANVTVTPGKDGSAQVHIDSELHVFDRYNWDAGKSVTIGPVTVTDAQMGQLHKAGIAREYETHGTSQGPSVDLSISNNDLRHK